MHHPSKARHLKRAFVSVNSIRHRKSNFEVGDWIMDSGAFTRILRDGTHEPAEEYATQIERWRTNGNMLRAVSQDWMCEPTMLARTGLSVEDHQALTVKRFLELRSMCGDVVMPVLQGWVPDDYARHVEQYGDSLADRAWVGVGSVCKRQGKPSAIIAVLSAILDKRPDLRLHGFGVKRQSLADDGVRSRLFSADSMAWSFAARYEGRDSNCWREAVRYADGIESMSVQGALF